MMRREEKKRACALRKNDTPFETFVFLFYFLKNFDDRFSLISIFLLIFFFFFDFKCFLFDLTILISGL